MLGGPRPGGLWARGREWPTHVVPFSMCLGSVRCRAWSLMAALTTACTKYTRAWVDSAAMRAMTRVRVSWRSRLGGKVTPSGVAAC